MILADVVLSILLYGAAIYDLLELDALRRRVRLDPETVPWPRLAIMAGMFVVAVLAVTDKDYVLAPGAGVLAGAEAMVVATWIKARRDTDTPQHRCCPPSGRGREDARAIANMLEGGSMIWQCRCRRCWILAGSGSWRLLPFAEQRRRQGTLAAVAFRLLPHRS